MYIRKRHNIIGLHVSVSGRHRVLITVITVVLYKIFPISIFDRLIGILYVWLLKCQSCPLCRYLSITATTINSAFIIVPIEFVLKSYSGEIRQIVIILAQQSWKRPKLRVVRLMLYLSPLTQRGLTFWVRGGDYSSH